MNLDLFGNPLEEKKVVSTNAKSVPTIPAVASFSNINPLYIRPGTIIKETPATCWLLHDSPYESKS